MSPFNKQTKVEPVPACPNKNMINKKKHCYKEHGDKIMVFVKTRKIKIAMTSPPMMKTKSK
jgi:hypothetical protein